MNIEAEKLNLVQAILNIDDANVIESLKQVLIAEDYDWFDDLTIDQQESVLRGLKQAERGETISHEEAKGRLGL